MQELLALLVTWLAVNAGLPPAETLPEIAFVPPARMMEIRLDAAGASGSPAAPGARHGQTDGLYAIYDDRSRTIYLAETWSAAAPADVSMLVHELVHHLQNAAGLTYACAEARERPAYKAQAGWLDLFGKTLESEFALDPMTLLLRTRCLR